MLIFFVDLVLISMKVQMVLELGASHLTHVVDGHVARHIVPLVLDSDVLFPRIRTSQASFKAVLIAVYMTNGFQTKCKTCFWGPRMILYAL